MTGQFTLRAAFIATALVALAAWLGKLGVTGPDLLCLLAVPVLLGAAVGVLAGKVPLRWSGRPSRRVT